MEPAADAAPSGRAMLTDALVVLAVFAVAGAVAGVVWPHLVTPVTVTRTPQGFSTGEDALAHRFSNDGWYTVLAGGGGLVLGVALSAWRRSHEVVTLLVIVAGAFIAAWLSAELGTALGPADPQQVLAHARDGQTAQDQVLVSAHAAYLVWPIAALVGSLVVLWSPPGRRLGRPDPRTRESVVQ